MSGKSPEKAGIYSQDFSVPEISKAAGYPRYWLTVKLGDIELKGLLDTGASRTVLGAKYSEVVDKLGTEIAPNECQYAQMANGQTEPIKGAINVPVEVAGICKNMRMLVIPNLPLDLILGLDFIKLFKMSIIASRDTFKLEDLGDKELIIDIGAIDPLTKELQLSSCGIRNSTKEQEKVIEELLDEVLPFDKESKILPATKLVEHEIVLLESTRPVKQRYYPVSERIEAAMHKELESLVEKDIVEKSQSPWNSPVVMVKKPNGDYRMCIDFRVVNSLSKKDAFPLPYMDCILNKLKNARYISTIDLSNAYHQIKLKKSCREITAFTVPGRGLFQYKRMPMGLSGAGACFQRLIEQVIGDLEPHAYSYLDDIVLATSTFEEHTKLLRKLLLNIKNAGLTINRTKSKFCRSEVKYLGFLVNEYGLMIDPEKTEAIRSYKRPKTLRQIRRFIGMSSWYRKFIKDYAKIIEPINKLVRKDFKYEWGEAQENAFQEIKRLLTEAPMLHRPVPGAEYFIHCDASDTGLGSMITQKVDDVERVIAYASTALKKSERNYSTTEKECLAIKTAIEKWRPYVEGEEFTVITDHSALQWLMKKKNPTGRLGRWAEELMSYNFKVKHRKGKDNVVPDALSRLHEDDDNVKVATVKTLPAIIDSWYKKRIHQIIKEPHKYRDWKVVGNMIYKYRANEKLNEIMTDLDAWKLVVPRENREKVMFENHSVPNAGHQGIEKTFKRVAQSYYWPNMYDDIATYVNGCLTCQQCKVEQKGRVGLMHTRIVTKPWQAVAVDLMGEFPRSKNGFEYLIIFEDVFTRYILCVPIRKKTALAVKKALENIVFARYGIMEKMISDNGTEFVNKTIKAILEECEIEFERTPAYHPQANPVERVNRDFKTMMAAFVDNNHREWDNHIPQLEFAYNTSQSSVTGHAPAFLLFGRQLTPPGSWKTEIDKMSRDLIEIERERIVAGNQSPALRKERENGGLRNLNSAEKAENPVMEGERRVNEGLNADEKSAIDNWAGRLRNLPIVHEKAAEKIQKEKEKQRRNYNKGKREHLFKIGDEVLKRNRVLSSTEKNITAKLCKKFIGPFKIAEITGKNVYALEKDGVRLEHTTHGCDLKVFRQPVWKNQKNEAQTAINAAARPCRRGRPRKNKSAIEPVITENPEDNIALSDANKFSNDAKTQKRKRGRPPKNKTSISENKTKAIEEENTTGAEGKKKTALEKKK